VPGFYYYDTVSKGRGSLLLSPPLRGGDLGEGGGEMIKMMEGGKDGP
jgi:hypothetical protein